MRGKTKTTIAITTLAFGLFLITGCSSQEAAPPADTTSPENAIVDPSPRPTTTEPIPDSTRDNDQDTILDRKDEDLDADGKKNNKDKDIDGDGFKNGEDLDMDGDNILNKKDPDPDGYEKKK